MASCPTCSCAVSNVKKVSLELGGKSPLIIFADCDMDKAVRVVSSSAGSRCARRSSRREGERLLRPFQGMSSVFFNKGENCIAAGRLFVEETIHDQFLTKVVRLSRPLTGSRFSEH